MGVNLAEITAVVLAGGLGTRIKHLLGDLPKPMLPVAGRPFLEWVVRYLARQGVRRVIISSGYKAEAIGDHFQQTPMDGVSVTCAAEPEPMGTGGGFLFAARQSKRPPPAWLVLNGDSIMFANLAALASAMDRPETIGVLVGRELPDTGRYGTMVVGAEAALLRFAEKQPGRGIINAGIYLLRHEALADFPHKSPLSFEVDVFPALLGKGRQLRVCLSNAPFLDIGTPETVIQAEGFIRANQSGFAL